ncbi:MAG: hypothetical protein A2915_03365 [Candidatus Yanofskybacteria bacterium RIFCSPLOWO2_01_FULL_41_34]|uniref:Glycosyl transferase family 1 domain-containing protein n=1 Tax=Candidatus Yanofskybacteria bacterium RIFCSPHIGHO2_01_FULL_41_26 TaxID=1802661 RepID=A0A1F8EDL9_9BACT|nr:MAG: hypothetical protein A2649_01260 [Candidatus Yanofskybacteria bacterium RIFCSPHIGHO2_01_FULL_41_26]OGN21069.1 MAG: hypothetical protein A2915_03365 [Candidatus Yanofskybacteria bacterium RIFCSPLOWO2_01_FULL_41_34]
MTQKSRVLILTTAYLPQVGGSELAIKNITDRLPGIYFDLITSRPPSAPTGGGGSKNIPAFEQMGNVNIYRVGNSFSLLNFLLPKNFFPIAIFLKAHQLMRKYGQYNIIHAFQASQAAGGGWLLKWIYPKTSLIVTIQEGKVLNKQSWLMRFFRYLIFRKTDSVTAISNYLAQYVKSQNPKIPISVIPNGVDLEKFTNHESRIMNHKKVIITVSRLVKKNGIGDLIEAVAMVIREIPDAKLMIVGDGPLEKNLKLKVKNLKLENHIEFLGDISNDLLPKYLFMADIFVRPSLSEGLGTAFLEAMAAGLPIVGTAVGGIPDFLKNGQTGLFCKVSDPKDLAEKIILLLSDKQLREKIINNGRALVAEKYNWNIIANEFAKIYERI